jgi:hypothetical protein
MLLGFRRLLAGSDHRRIKELTALLREALLDVMINPLGGTPDNAQTSLVVSIPAQLLLTL